MSEALSSCVYGVFDFVTESHHIAQAGPDLVVFLPQPPECKDYGMALPHPVMSLIFLVFFFLSEWNANNNIYRV